MIPNSFASMLSVKKTLLAIEYWLSEILFWGGLLAHTGASLQSEIPLLTRKFCGEIPPVSPQAFSKARNKMNYTSCKEIFEFSAKKLIFHKQYKGYFLAAVDASRTVSYTNALSSFAFRKSFNTVPISPKIAIPLSSMNSGKNWYSEFTEI